MLEIPLLPLQPFLGMKLDYTFKYNNNILHRQDKDFFGFVKNVCTSLNNLHVFCAKIDIFNDFAPESAVSAVAGVAETDNSNDADGKSTGIILCNACAGEDAFDIGKRFGVPSQRVRELNPDSAEPFKDGDKLLLFV